MVAVDTETNPSTWQTLHVIIDHPRITGNVYALAMHNRIFKILADRKKFYDSNIRIVKPEELYDVFCEFIAQNNPESTKKAGTYTITVAGKNAANFDIPFLKKHFNKFSNTKFSELNDDPNNREIINFRKRVIDPAVLYTDFLNDDMVAEMKVCKERAGLGSIVTHNALEDSWDVVMLICAHMGWDFSKMITPEFVEKNWTESEFKSVIGRNWILHNTEIGNGCLMLIENKEDTNPFNRWILNRTVSAAYLIEDFIWNTDVLTKFIPIKNKI